MSDAAAISVRDARKAYQRLPSLVRKTVVDGMSLDVPKGSIHGLLGPNGAGKTTTLKMLLGLVRPDAGTFEILGKDAGRPEAREPVGFLPEQPYFPMQLKARRAMRLYSRLSGAPAAGERDEIPGLLERVGLGSHADEPLATYSRGMLQRFGIAQALLDSPKVLVLDEPASGLDPIGQRDVRNLMLELRDAGVTVLLSSHQLSEVEAVCDRVTIMNRGRVAAEGSLDDLLNVEGQTSIRARGFGDELPGPVRDLTTEVAASGGAWVFSVADDSLRAAVDAVDDAGGAIESVSPKRESLEDYFARMLQTRLGDEEAAS